MKENNNKIIIYNTEDGQTKIDVRLDNDTVWLSQAQMADLFDKDRKTVTEHIQNVFKEGELVEDSVCRKFQHTAADKKRYKMRVMYMKDWIQKLDSFLILNDKEILGSSGGISRKDMEYKVRHELELFNRKQLK